LFILEILTNKNYLSNAGTGITWIIIFLIVLSILVTCSEVFLRFGLLAKNGHEVKVISAAAGLLGIEEIPASMMRGAMTGDL
jgi:hypothetical protein